MDSLRNFAATAKQKTREGLAAAAAKGSKALDVAREKSKEAYSHASSAAQHALSSNPAMALVGTEITVAGKHLIVDSLLAEGGFASVYLVYTKPVEQFGAGGSGAAAGGGEKFVLKKMHAGGSESISQLTNEVKLMQRLSHPGIVRVIGAESKASRRDGDGVDINVLLEFCPGGHLLARLNKQLESGKPLPPLKVVEMFLAIVRPVAYLHALSPPVAHRDLKFENVLIASDGSLRLCDFGSASTHAGVIADKRDRAEQEDAIARFTTPHFRAPEQVDLYNGQPLDERVDIWALGCMLYGLAWFKHPFQDSGPLGILSGKYKVPASPAMPPPIMTMLKACLQIKPDDRPTAAQLVSYIESLQKGGAEAFIKGPWPALSLSGGGSVATSAGDAEPSSSSSSDRDRDSAPASSSSDAAAASGSSAASISGTGVGGRPHRMHVSGGSGSGATASSSASSASAASTAHTPTSVFGGGSVGVGGPPSAALAARLARKGVHSGPAAVTPTAAALPSPSTAAAAPAEAASAHASSAASAGAFGDTEFGRSGGSGSSSSSRSLAPATAPTTAPSEFDASDAFSTMGFGETDSTAAAPAAADGFNFDDFFSPPAAAAAPAPFKSTGSSSRHTAAASAASTVQPRDSDLLSPSASSGAASEGAGRGSNGSSRGASAATATSSSDDAFDMIQLGGRSSAAAPADDLVLLYSGGSGSAAAAPAQSNRGVVKQSPAPAPAASSLDDFFSFG